MKDEAYVAVSRHVLYRLGGELYAFPVTVVREMVRVLPAAKVPGAPACVRGVVNLRGTILPLVDLRVALGMQSALAEINGLCDLLAQRRRDHQDWLAALEHSVKTGQPFTKTTDPTQCAFGKWYAGFKTDHLLLRGALARLDAPHKAIHAAADEALKLVRQGDTAGAMELINQRRKTHLNELLATLDHLCALIRDEQRELVIIVEGEHRAVGVCVDSIEGVEQLAERGQALGHLIGAESDMVNIVLRKGSERPVQLLSLDRVFNALITPDGRWLADGQSSSPKTSPKTVRPPRIALPTSGAGSPRFA
ncbi:MAG: chemotaxis protein CheW [Polyangiaceae bacterium]